MSPVVPKLYEMCRISAPLARRAFSQTTTTTAGGTISVTPTILKRIQADLVEADVNGDRRIDFEELKLLLAKYPCTFSKEDIDRVGDLFWVGQSGGSVRHTTFLRGIQHVARKNSDDSSNSSNKNPMQMESLDDQRCWVSPEEAKEADFHNVQAQFDECLADYVKEVSCIGSEDEEEKESK